MALNSSVYNDFLQLVRLGIGHRAGALSANPDWKQRLVYDDNRFVSFWTSLGEHIFRPKPPSLPVSTTFTEF